MSHKHRALIHGMTEGKWQRNKIKIEKKEQNHVFALAEFRLLQEFVCTDMSVRACVGECGCV